MSDNKTAHAANEYDISVKKTIPFYGQFHQETIHLIKQHNSNPAKWLDTGGGTGTLIEKAYPFFEGTKYILADPSSAMIEKAKERLKSISEENIVFLNGIGSQSLMHLIGEEMDVVTAIMAHHYLNKEGRNEATQNIYSILKDGGIYVTFENIYPLSETGTEIGLKRWSEFQVTQGKEEVEVIKHTKRFNNAYYPITIEEHLQVLREAGFRACEVLWYAYMQAGFYAIK